MTVPRRRRRIPLFLRFALVATHLIFFWSPLTAQDSARKPQYVTAPRLFTTVPAVVPSANDTSRPGARVLTPRNEQKPSIDDFRRLRDENLRLRQMLQSMELDRLKAVSNAVDSNEANALRDSVWRTRVLEVTWENPTAVPDEERQWVRSAIERTWQAESGLNFINWGTSEPGSRGIRILISDTPPNEHPNCKRLGSHLDGVKDGMVLNFAFHNWCPECTTPAAGGRRAAIEKIAIHEFGHALGFAHEQNRSDAPDWCRQEAQGQDGDWYVTLYDPNSIMNYCSPEWNNGGRLSDLDIVAVRTLYGPPRPTHP